MLCQSFVAKSVGFISSLDVWGQSVKSDDENTVLTGNTTPLRLVSTDAQDCCLLVKSWALLLLLGG